MWLTPRAVLGLFMLFAVLVLPQSAGIAGWRYKKFNCVQSGMAAAGVFLCTWFVVILLMVHEDSIHRQAEMQRVAAANAAAPPSDEAARRAQEMAMFEAEHGCGMGSGLAVVFAPVYAGIHFAVAALMRDACESFSRWRGRRARSVRV